MSRFYTPLNNIRIASPCPANWDAMYGSERKRFCGECKLNVYNLAGMTRAEAEELLLRSEGRLCVRFYRRADGTILTSDCPVGWAKVKQRAALIATAALSAIITMFSGLFSVSFLNRNNENLFRLPNFVEKLRPDPVVMGTLEMAPVPIRKTKPSSDDGSAEWTTGVMIERRSNKRSKPAGDETWLQR
jgi:hypothetical protein